MSIDKQIQAIVDALNANTESNKALSFALTEHTRRFSTVAAESTFSEPSDFDDADGSEAENSTEGLAEYIKGQETVEDVEKQLKDALETDRKEAASAKKLIKAAEADEAAEKAAAKEAKAAKAKASAEAKAMIEKATETVAEAKAAKTFKKVDAAEETEAELFESTRTKVVLAVKHLGRDFVGEVLKNDFGVKNIKELSVTGLKDLRVQLEEALVEAQIPF